MKAISISIIWCIAYFVGHNSPSYTNLIIAVASIVAFELLVKMLVYVYNSF